MRFNEIMDDVKKMFRTIVNGQSAMKQELLREIKKINLTVGRLEAKTDEGFKQVNIRLDTIGKSVTSL
jgi:hypothetical protein